MATRNRAAEGAIVVRDARLAACLEAGPPDIGALWEFCMYFEFDREVTADGIAAWLGPADGLRVLDCACGSGFPALELARRGYDLTCTDGSEAMLTHFRRNARLAGIELDAELVRWDDLPKRYGGTFDVVMNRGGGNYIYAGVWDEEGLATRTAMSDALGQWIACVRPGGRFYVDITRAADLARPEPNRVRHPAMLVGEHVVEIEEEIGIDRDTMIRIWQAVLTVDGEEHEFRRRCRPLQHAELIDILTSHGLVEVRKTPIRGEYYDVYTAIRPQEGSGP
jgi:SAM-dependent methyltransferase